MSFEGEFSHFINYILSWSLYIKDTVKLMLVLIFFLFQTGAKGRQCITLLSPDILQDFPLRKF